MIEDSLPLCGDQDPTLEQQNTDEWIHTPFMMDLLDKEGQAATAAHGADSAKSAPAEAWESVWLK